MRRKPGTTGKEAHRGEKKARHNREEKPTEVGRNPAYTHAGTRFLAFYLKFDSGCDLEFSRDLIQALIGVSNKGLLHQDFDQGFSIYLDFH